MTNTEKTAPARSDVNAFIGRWRIVSMVCKDDDYFDMEVAAHITIRDDLSGEFRFGVVQGQINGRMTGLGAGFDENDPLSGRGLLRADGDRAEGQIEFDLGDKSKLEARRVRVVALQPTHGLISSQLTRRPGFRNFSCSRYRRSSGSTQICYEIAAVDPLETKLPSRHTC